MLPNQVVAYSPNELVAAQGTVRGWCAESIRRLLVERREAEQNLVEASGTPFRTAPFERIINKCSRKIEYFKKIGAAIKLGYMIVPNFDMDLFAVRTKALKPRHRENSWSGQFVENGQALPEGEGRYVDSRPFEKRRTEVETDAAGKKTEKRVYFPTKFDEDLDFPVALVKPQILTQTKRAMGYRLFDQIGVARGGYTLRRDDPIVCGRIIDPTKRGKAVTFFIAWWLDRDDI